LKHFTKVALFLLLKTSALAQNLCTNGGFETYTSLPNTYAQTCRASGWYSASGVCNLIVGTGSPDYYHTSGSGGANPPNTWWATVSPHTGGGMMGFVTYYAPSSPNYREYIERPLSSPMVAGQEYSVDFWITNGISSLHNDGTNRIGVNFSLSSIAQSTGTPILLTPQIEIPTVVYSTIWKHYTLLFTPTQAYNYMTIGNFHNDATTTVGGFGASLYGAYYYIDDIVVTPHITLPVELVQFYGRPRGAVNDLFWETASEEGSDYFTVERSSDGVFFDSIGNIAAHGNSASVNNYQFTDASPFEDKNYYRLKEANLDGSYKYSRMITLKTGDYSFNLYPNPTNGKFTVAPVSDRPMDIHLYSVSGVSLFHTTIEKYPKEIDLSEFAKGIYFLKASDEENVYTEKLSLR
jgi:hypothetical protein